MRSVNLIPVVVLLTIQGVLSQTLCPACPDRFGADGVTPCTKVVSTNPCSCSYTCVSQPICNFAQDQAACNARAINGLVCRFNIVDQTKCQTSCSCSSVSTSPGTCDFTAPQADCLRKDPKCVFRVISQTNCASSCRCPAKPAPCDFTAAKAKCATAGCTLDILSSDPLRCHSQCNCTKSTASSVCDTALFATVQSECNAKPGCVFSADPYNCQVGCTCTSESSTTVQVPATCDEAYFKSKCLSTKDAVCTYNRGSLTDCSLQCSCVSTTGVVVPGECDVEFYRNRCLTTPGATCDFTQEPNTCNLACNCIKK